MSAQILHAPLDEAAMEPATIYIRETRDELLAYEKDELAALRFSIILTARWEHSGRETPDRRAELGADLALLRNHYEDKIDEIAMTFGVEQAMKVKAEVERTVFVPREVKPMGSMADEEEIGNEEFGAGGYEL
jgi:hypothetical protein